MAIQVTTLPSCCLSLHPAVRPCFSVRRIRSLIQCIAIFNPAGFVRLRRQVLQQRLRNRRRQRAGKLVSDAGGRLGKPAVMECCVMRVITLHGARCKSAARVRQRACRAVGAARTSCCFSAKRVVAVLFQSSDQKENARVHVAADILSVNDVPPLPNSDCDK
jgi:hypothetical protein